MELLLVIFDRPPAPGGHRSARPKRVRWWPKPERALPAYDHAAEGEQVVADRGPVKSAPGWRGAGDEHEAEHPLGDLPAPPARSDTHRVPDDQGVAHAGVVHDGHEVAGEADHRHVIDGEVARPAPRRSGEARASVAARVGQQARMAGRFEPGEELPPVGVAARPAVGEHDRHARPIGVAVGVGDRGPVIGADPSLLGKQGVALVGTGGGFPGGIDELGHGSLSGLRQVLLARTFASGEDHTNVIPCVACTVRRCRPPPAPDRTGAARSGTTLGVSP